MHTDNTLEVLSELGRIMLEAGSLSVMEEAVQEVPRQVAFLDSLVRRCGISNPWFIPEFTRYSLRAWGEALQPKKVRKWLETYPERGGGEGAPKKVAVIMAGNLPMVGLHDLLCVLASGNEAMVKLSSQDDILIPGILEVLGSIEPSWKERVGFADAAMKGFEAVIATGSDNTSRYFEYYFGKYPHIIRKNRNATAVVTGEETPEWFRWLADDIFLYFGLGCRSVSKLYLPEKFDPATVLQHFSGYSFVGAHSKYANNYDYQKSIMMVNRMPFQDNGFVLLRRDVSIASPVAILNYEHYRSLEDLQEQLGFQSEQIQCTVALPGRIEGAVPAGRSQMPELWDYADGVDTMEFLTNL